MTKASANARLSMAATGSRPAYVLKSDLGRFCLPSSSRDDTRRYAYAVSISIFFLVAGVLGLRRPELYDRALPPVQDLTHVVELEQEKAPDPEPVPMDPNEPPPPEIVTEAPHRVTAVVRPDQAAFSVPVKGPVVFAPSAALASPPPPANQQQGAGNGPVRFTRNKTAGGFYPDPTYPPDLMRRRVSGTVELLIRVDETGRVASVEVYKSSGTTQLDRHAMQSVKDRWRFPAGQHPPYLWACEFRLP